MSNPRVLVTGLGPLCSLGGDAKTLWSTLLAGRTFVGSLDRLAGAPTTLGAEVKGFDGCGVLDPRERQYDRAMQFAIVAAHRAIEDAGLLRDGRFAGGTGGSASSPAPVQDSSGLPPAGALVPERVGIVVGTSRGAAELLEAAHRRFADRGAEGVGPRVSPLTTPGNLSGAAARHLGLRGPCLTVSAACASASQAIGLAFDLVRRGRADAIVAGGTEACLTPFVMAMFASTGILSRRADDPPRACRPFDRDRDGIVIGEGAGMIVLESESSARARAARAYCELLGFGMTCDARSLTGVPEDGEGLARAIRLALEDAGTAPGAVDYVNAHGAGTVAGDRAETAAIKAALGPRARAVPVSSTKSMTGHLIGAAGGIEAAVCALAVAEGAVPPTINLDHPDPACDLDYVPREARRVPVRLALSNAMGFGGNNAVLAFGTA
jgi:3-oxoacyl-[acyl-carrier-protein] synthase II